MEKKVKEGYKSICILEIYQIDFICNILIPHFDSIKFRTKKYLDYLDFRTIAFLIYDGKHLLENGKELILKLANSMNNSRLSTSSDKFIIDSKTKYALEELIKLEPLISVNSEGRAMILKEHKYIRSTYIIILVGY